MAGRNAWPVTTGCPTAFAKVALTEKCAFVQDQMKFLGHIVDHAGARPDSDKVSMILKLRTPTCVDVRRLLGMTNQLGKFSPNLANKTGPLRDLLKTTSSAGTSHNAIHLKISDLISAEGQCCQCSHQPTVSADASSLGLGAVVLQKLEN